MDMKKASWMKIPQASTIMSDSLGAILSAPDLPLFMDVATSIYFLMSMFVSQSVIGVSTQFSYKVSYLRLLHAYGFLSAER